MDPILEKITVQSANIPEFTEIVSDSREVKENSLFVAIAGFENDGHDFVLDAEKNGAVGVITERIVPSISIPQWVVLDSRRALSRLAHQFYNKPFSNKPIIGVTGTNGKTTIITAISKFLNDAGIQTGTIGTLGLHQTQIHTNPTKLTTPESLQLQRMLRYLEDASMACCAMEVSSHALVLQRVADVSFSTAIFTNLSRDHLDFHKNLDDYFHAKSLLFSQLKNDAVAIINLDDSRSNKLISLTNSKIITYSLTDEIADYCGKYIRTTATGLEGKIMTRDGDISVRSPIIGKFNISNLLAAIAASIVHGAPQKSIEKSIRNFTGAPGRLERFDTNRANFYIDYAHTPDGYNNIFETINEIRQNAKSSGKIITIFGCGGNRDTQKRSMIAKITEKYSDIIIITNDNPRFEDPELIISHILNGLEDPNRYMVIRDREKAIQQAVDISTSNDFVLLLGKGHEKYQDIQGQKIPYSESDALRKALNE